MLAESKNILGASYNLIESIYKQNPKTMTKMIKGVNKMRNNDKFQISQEDHDEILINTMRYSPDVIAQINKGKTTKN